MRFAAYFSMASKALAAFNAEKFGTHLALCHIISEAKLLQNFRSCGTRYKYCRIYPEIRFQNSYFWGVLKHRPQNEITYIWGVGYANGKAP